MTKMEKEDQKISAFIFFELGSMKVKRLTTTGHNQPNAKEEIEDFGHCDKIRIKIPGPLQFNDSMWH